MMIAFAPRLSFSMRRFGVTTAPYFSNDEGSTNIWIQCQLPEFSEVFESDVRPDNTGFSRATLRAAFLGERGVRVR